MHDQDWTCLHRRPASPPLRESGVWPIGWHRFVEAALAELWLEPIEHPHVLLAVLGARPVVDLRDWSFIAYRLAAVLLLERAGREPNAASVDGVMRELILPRAVARAISPAQLPDVNPYVDPEHLLQLYVIQRGGSGEFPAVR